MRLLVYIGPAVDIRLGVLCDYIISVVLKDGLLGFKS